MVDYKTCKLEDILNDAKDSKKRTEALKAFALSGDKPSFLTIKRWYYKSYYPEMVPTAKPKSKDMWSRIAEL